MSEVKASAETAATELQFKVQAAKTDATATWDDMQRDWKTHIDSVRADIDRKKAEVGASNATMRAEWAESDADLAISLAYAAIEEADYAVLQALLARREADEAAGVLAR